VSIANTDKPWLFTSGCRGLLRCRVPLTDGSSGLGAASYTVRFGFNALPGEKAGRRVFDIKLQGKVVLERFDIMETAGRANCAVVKEFKGVEARESLALELVPKSTNPQADQAPTINFIEVIREDAGKVAVASSKSARL
jgi:hypothetical protein